MTYDYKTDDGEVVSLDYTEFCLKDDCGFITLDDGRVAKRTNRPTERKSTKTINGSPKIISDALGFTESQLPVFEEDRIKNRIKGIEFRRDPDVPQFIQVVCDSESAKQKYMKHRQMIDKNSRNGGSHSISELEFEKLRQRFL